MTTTDLIIGGAIVLLVVRQVRATFLEHLHADRPTTGRDLVQLIASGVSAVSGTALGAAGGIVAGTASGSAPSRGVGAGARWLVSVGARLAFFVWLYDITDGAAFMPFGAAPDVFGGTVWQPQLIALGLSEVVARLGALAVRGVTDRRRRDVTAPTCSLTKAPLRGE